MSMVNLRIAKNDRPRLGDYYGSIGWDGLYAYCGRHSFITFQIGRDVFKRAPCDVELPPREAVLMGDAFAFGAVKYGSVGGWRGVPLDHHLQSAGGHFDAWLHNCEAIDEESQLSHEGLFLARAMMILALRSEDA